MRLNVSIMDCKSSGVQLENGNGKGRVAFQVLSRGKKLRYDHVYIYSCFHAKGEMS